MNITDRIKTIIKVNQLSSSAFADEIGVQRSSVSHILSGRNNPSLEFIQKTLQRFPKVNAEWLISGKHPVQENKSVDEEVFNPHSEINTIKEELNLPDRIPNSNRSIKKIMIIYSDNTLEEFVPPQK